MHLPASAPQHCARAPHASPLHSVDTGFRCTAGPVQYHLLFQEVPVEYWLLATETHQIVTTWPREHDSALLCCQISPARINMVGKEFCTWFLGGLAVTRYRLPISGQSSLPSQSRTCTDMMGFTYTSPTSHDHLQMYHLAVTIKTDRSDLTELKQRTDMDSAIVRIEKMDAILRWTHGGAAVWRCR